MPAYRTRARELEGAFAQRNGVAEIAALLDEVIGERRAGRRTTFFHAGDPPARRDVPVHG